MLLLLGSATYYTRSTRLLLYCMLFCMARILGCLVVLSMLRLLSSRLYLLRRQQLLLLLLLLLHLVLAPLSCLRWSIYTLPNNSSAIAGI